MDLIHGRRTKNLILCGRVLLLTVSIGFTVPVIMAASIMTPLNPPTQVTLLVAKERANNNAEGTKEWDKTYGGPDKDSGEWVEQTADGGYIIVGYTWSIIGGWGGTDIWLIKTDADGTVEWTQTYTEVGFSEGECVKQTTDGGYIIAGKTDNTSADTAVWLIKMDADGNTEWTQIYAGGTIDDKNEGKCVEQTADGGYISVGLTEAYGAGGYDVWLIKTDATGTAEWNQTYGGPSRDLGECVMQTADGGYIIAGETGSFGAGAGDVWLIKTDAAGTAEWTQTYGGPGWDEGRWMEQTADGGYIITGATKSYGAGAGDVWLIKTDATGTVEWTQTYGTEYGDRGECVEQTMDGGYIITGTTESYGAGQYDVWLIKTDAAGTAEWTQTYGGSGADYGYCVKQTTDGGYIITGKTESYGAGQYDVWLIKVSGAVTSPEVSETETVTSPEVSEVPWSTVFLALVVLGIVLVQGRVFGKRKR